MSPGSVSDCTLLTAGVLVGEEGRRRGREGGGRRGKGRRAERWEEVRGGERREEGKRVGERRVEVRWKRMERGVDGEDSPKLCMEVT